MSVYSVSGRSTAAATAVLPALSLYATAAVRPRIREVGIFNTTTTGFVASLQRLAATGTQGAGLSEVAVDMPEQAAIATAFAAHTAGTPITGGIEIRRADIGAAFGSGVVWTFSGGSGLVIPDGTANGVGVVCPTGTGQVFDYYLEWEE